MSLLKSIARDWLPPALQRSLRQHGSSHIRFEGKFSTWEEARAHSGGYDAENILAKVLAATLEVKEGKAAFERDSILFHQIEYEWPVLTGLLAAAVRNHGTLNVLDFGGSLGSTYFQNRELLKAVPAVRWNVVEQPNYVKAGIAYIENEYLHFYPSISACLADNNINVILVSSVLQYLPDPDNVFHSLLTVDADTIILDRTIVNRSDSHRLYVQHVPPSIYLASYPCRSLSISTLLSMATDRYTITADFPSLSFPALASIDSEFRGYLLTRRRGVNCTKERSESSH